MRHLRMVMMCIRLHEGGSVDVEGGDGEDFDWLEEGFEGPDFDDDVFGNVDDRPSTHDGVSGSAAASHRPSKGDTLANNDLPLEEGEWIDPPLLEDDMESLVDSDDDQLAPTTAKEPEFNIQTAENQCYRKE